jgi:multidrug efflux pump subunit AcrA (membrane-fusion protein)
MVHAPQFRADFGAPEHEVLLARSAKIDRPLSAPGSPRTVWLFDPASGSVGLRKVTVLRYETDRVLVSAGLVNGDRVVVAGVQKLRPGQKVRLLADAGQ